MTDRSHDVAPTPRRRLLAIVLAGLLPWTVVFGGDTATFVHAFGIVTLDPPGLVNLYEYLFVLTDGLPRRLQAWPASVLLYLGALASAAVGVSGREDVRLTAGLLFFAGVAHLHVGYGLYRVGTASVPVVPLFAWGIVWWYYWPLVRDRGLLSRPE